MPSSKTLIRRDATFISLNMGRPALIKAMRLHGLTATKVIAPIVEALQADKVAIVGNGQKAMAEVTPDHATRLRAAQLAIQLLQLTKDIPDNPLSDNLNEKLSEAIADSDEIELQRVVFNKKSKDKVIEAESVK